MTVRWVANGTRNRHNRLIDLPADLPLPLDRGAPWWYWLGGRPALDFANTVRERWARSVETLVTTDDLAEWLVAAELAPELPAVDAALLAEARALREAIDAAVVAQLAGVTPPGSALAVIDGWLPTAAPAPTLRVDAHGRPALGPAPVQDAARHALALVALDAAELLGTAERERLRICASESCSARFFDRSPAGKRRWCSMRGCGNAAKARRHRARQRLAKAAAPQPA
jgi:predicted RNA-binding Zn ribbon-like protein